MCSGRGHLWGGRRQLYKNYGVFTWPLLSKYDEQKMNRKVQCCRAQDGRISNRKQISNSTCLQCKTTHLPAWSCFGEQCGQQYRRFFLWYHRPRRSQNSAGMSRSVDPPELMGLSALALRVPDERCRHVKEALESTATGWPRPLLVPEPKNEGR